MSKDIVTIHKDELIGLLNDVASFKIIDIKPIFTVEDNLIVCWTYELTYKE